MGRLLNIELGELKDLDFDLSLTGFDAGEIDGLLAGSWTPPARETQKPAPAPETCAPAGQIDDDAAPDLQPEPVTVPGDVWLLNGHRVLCGDATSIDATARLFRGAKPGLCVTDPPYGIAIVRPNKDSANSQGIMGRGGSGDSIYPFGGVKNGVIGAKPWGDAKGTIGGENVVKPKQYAQVINDDSTATAQQFYHCAIAAGIQNFIIFGGNYFTAFLPPSPCWVVWNKQNSGNFADVEMAWTSFDYAAKLYSFPWNGMSREGDRQTELVTRVHPTQKPVGLFTQIFADFPFEICYDGFLGSGSTLIAAEKTGRTCYGMELSPQYVDVIVKRWQDFTGGQAILEGDGRTFDEVRAHRNTEVAA